jgi:hypothetical protein
MSEMSSSTSMKDVGAALSDDTATGAEISHKTAWTPCAAG